MSARFGRPNGDPRGNSRDRRAQKMWLVSIDAGWGGDGETVPCWECGVVLWTEDLIRDRIIPAERGGTYARSNIAPHCALCSHRQGNQRTQEILRMKRAEPAAAIASSSVVG